ncbi:MAG: hypothetical protein IAX21_00805 [Candidatus Bathyarchaeota archaeon]|nr:hypothetical protein [Candidatus Bathyarchaeum tardum]WGM90490.1 MAG: hypothetical protein NUK63_05035 [Candidatus Bathyarchaeum tardum]WNZ29442.1 MAG: hypothetical protein IAX21_00805 [Candidatus Bathyarchaeota archaeon]
MERTAINDIAIKIPVDLMKEFKKDIRVVVRWPWLIGIPIPEALLRPELIKQFSEEYDVMLVPKDIKQF